MSSLSRCCEPQDLHIQAGNFLVEQAVAHAVSESKACKTSKLETCFQCNHCRCTKLPEWLVDSMTSVVTWAVGEKKKHTVVNFDCCCSFIQSHMDDQACTIRICAVEANTTDSQCRT